LARYHFVTDMLLPVTREQASGYLGEPLGWQAHWRWLRAVEAVDHTPGSAYGVGSRFLTTFATPLGYSVTILSEVTHSEPPWLLETAASGDLRGSGRWELFAVEGATQVRYTWVVDTTRRWMNLLAPVGRRVFAWNHDVLMRDFARGFADALGVELTSVESRTGHGG
jgi:hypothetical protein